MQEERSYKRRFHRAPLRVPMLFLEDQHLYKALAENISQGGVLMKHLPHYPEAEQIPLLIAIPQAPYLEHCSLDFLLSHQMKDQEKCVFRVYGKPVRKIEQKDASFDIFHKCLGVSFVEPPAKLHKAIDEFVHITHRNMAYVMKSFEGSTRDHNKIKRMRAMASYLGHVEKSRRLKDLHEDIKRDYQGLQRL